MSKVFKNIKLWYRLGIWSKEQVHNAVGKKITKEEYEIITNEKYEEEE